jgi:hypothetical protein
MSPQKPCVERLIVIRVSGKHDLQIASMPTNRATGMYVFVSAGRGRACGYPEYAHARNDEMNVELHFQEDKVLWDKKFLKFSFKGPFILEQAIVINVGILIF